MKQSTKRLASSLLAIAFIVGALVLLFNFIQPAYNDLQQIKSAVVSREVFAKNQKDVVDQVKNLIAVVEGGQELQNVVSLAVPLQPDVSGAVAQVNGIAETNGLLPQVFGVTVTAPQIQAVARGKTATGPRLRPVGTVSVRVRLTGRYEDFKGFLENIETNLRLMDTQSIDLQPILIPGKAVSEMYNFDVTVNAYYQPST